MAEEAESAEDQQDDAPEGDDEDAEPSKRKLPGKKLVLFVVLPVVLLLGIGGAVFFLDPFGSSGGGEEEVAEAEPPKPVLFYEMPDMLVNLSHRDKRNQYLKLKVALEMTDADTRSAIAPMMPRIMDIFQIYLRELRREDLEGSAGVYRLKEELLRRINLVLSPRKIDRILFKEMIVQ
ncbi:MAG: flagellar basal body-associated FliL family protein [Hyphomicrobiales bacterium]